MTRPYFFLLLFSLFIPSIWGKTLSSEEITELFAQGNSFFRQANELARKDPGEAHELFQKAALRFERIANEGKVANGKLEYNIGNAYFRMEDLGRAILHYRRALDYTPNDTKLQQNIASARARCEDRIPEAERQKVLETLLFLHYDFTMQTRSILFMASFLLLWVLIAINLFRRDRFLRLPIGLFALVSVFFFASLTVETLHRRRNQPGVVLSREIIARKGDSESFEPAFTEPLHAGTEFELLENRGSWFEVRLADGRSCWLPSSSVELVRPLPEEKTN